MLYTDELAEELKQAVSDIELKQEEDENYTFEVVATTEDEDRDNEVVEIEAWETDNWEKNPVVLANHNYTIENIIGKWLRFYTEDGVKKLKGVFSKTNPMAKLAKDLYDEGMLQTVSVGFIPLERDENDKSIIKKAELLEVSFVAVPANPNAVSLDSQTYRKAKKKGLIKEQRIISTARTPDYEGTETTNWGEISKDLEDFVDGYYTQNPDAEPESQEEIPETVDDMPAAMKNWIAQKTLLGDPNAGTFENLAFFPVVNPQTDNLNKWALVGVRSGRGQQAEIPETAYESADQKAKELLSEEFGVEYNSYEKKEEEDTKSPACRKEDETKDECVARKIPELMGEGMWQSQAIAVANEMCSESCNEQEDEKEKNNHKDIQKIMQEDIKDLKSEMSEIKDILKSIADGKAKQNEVDKQAADAKAKKEALQEINKATATALHKLKQL